MSDGESRIFITKIDAAGRQIDAAIRMTFVNEEALAIHSVAAAAYEILRDIKRKRNRSELSDIYTSGLYALADKFAKGTLTEDTDNYGPLAELIIEMGVMIKRKNISSFEEFQSQWNIHFPTKSEEKHWREFRLPANFLKHADRDWDSALPLDSIQNDQLLISACSSYYDILRKLTTEMSIFCIYALAPTVGAPEWTHKMNERFTKLDLEERKRFCMNLLQKHNDNQRRSSYRNPKLGPSLADVEFDD